MPSSSNRGFVMFPPLQRLVDYLGHNVYGVQFSGTNSSFKRVTPEELSMSSYMNLNRRGFIKWMSISCDLGLMGYVTPEYFKDLVGHHVSTLGVKTPSFVIHNPNNGHVEFWYELKHPINRYKKGKARKFFNVVYTRLRYRLNGRFEHLQTTAMSPWWDEHTLVELLDHQYTLEELNIPGLDVPDEVAMFSLTDYCVEKGREFGIRLIQTSFPNKMDKYQCRDLIHNYLVNCRLPLSFESRTFIEFEMIALNLSVWLVETYYPKLKRFKEEQSRRGKLNGQTQRDKYLDRVLELHKNGVSSRKIATETGIARSTIRTWIKSSNHAGS